MSFVKPARLTPQKIKANRRNARKRRGPQPGPATADRHAILRAALGDCLCPGYLRHALVALHENPVQFGRHHQQLIDEWQPAPHLRKLGLFAARLGFKAGMCQFFNSLTLSRLHSRFGPGVRATAASGVG